MDKDLNALCDIVKEGKTLPILNIYWVRHGYSCANFVRDTEKTWYNRFPHTFVKDPKLHHVGVEQAQQLAQDLEQTGVKFDLVCSSQLLRAMETGKKLSYILNPTIQDKVLVLPHINEELSTHDNIPFRFMNRKYPSFTNNLLGNIVEPLSDYKSFITKVIIPLTNYLSEKIPEPRDTYNVIIVSHSTFLKSIFDIKLDNCQYIIEKNVFDNLETLCSRMREFRDSFSDAVKYVVKYKTSKFDKVSGTRKIYDGYSSKEDKGGCKDVDQELIDIENSNYKPVHDRWFFKKSIKPKKSSTKLIKPKRSIKPKKSKTKSIKPKKSLKPKKSKTKSIKPKKSPKPKKSIKSKKSVKPKKSTKKSSKKSI